MRLPVSPRALLIALVALVVVDVALLLVGPPAPPASFRIPDRTVAGYDEFVASAAAQQGARVAVVGDSVVYGTFALPSDTLSSQMTDVFAEQGLDARAHNFGLSGAHATDYLPLIADLVEEDAADVIVLNFDYRFYDKAESLTRRYPELYRKVSSSSAPRPDDPLMQPSDQATRTFDDAAAEAVGRVWTLYRMREYLAAVASGDAPKRATELASANWRAGLQDRPLYTKRATKQLKAADVREAFNVAPFEQNNPHLIRLARALDIAEQSGTKVYVFAGPADAKLLTEQGWWDRTAYEKNLAYAKSLVEEHGGVWLDYTDEVPSTELADTHHPLAPGYRRLAERLADDTRQAVESAALRRAEEASAP